MKPPSKPTVFPDNRFTAYLEDRNIPSPWKLKSHYHYGYELIYYLAGGSRIRIGKKTWKAGPGDLAVFRPGTAHEEEIQAGPYRIICLRFPTTQVDLPLPGNRDLPPVIQLPWRVKFQHILEQIIAEKQHDDPWSERMTGTYLLQFVVLLWRALSRFQKTLPAQPDGNPERIHRLIDLIDNEMHADLKLTDLASKAFMSTSHFSHTFKDMTGVSPKRYIISARIEKAQELLANTDDSAASIAEALGFESPHYFNRLFKKKCGCTPMQYRKNSRKVQSK